jgi:hypothetical protein
MKKILTVVLLWTALCGTAFSQNASDFTVDANGVITKYNGFDTDIKIPDTIGGKKITVIGGGAFRKADLTSVTIPNGVTEIGNNAFRENKLTSITIPGSVKKIGEQAFRNNTIATIAIPEGVESIGKLAFADTKCASVIIPSTIKELGDNAFDDSGKPTFTLPANINFEFPLRYRYDRDGDKNSGSDYIDQLFISYIANDRKAGTYEWLDSISATKKADDFSYYETPYGAVLYGYGGSSTRLRIPAEIGGIPVKAIYGYLDRVYGFQGAFQSKRLDAVQIPESVTYIGNGAFKSNNMASVTIPNSVTYIGKEAFNRNQLASITIPDSVTYIEESAFESNQLTSVTFGKGVTYIRKKAFSDNKLESLTIPNGITSIEQQVFSKNQITSITFPNSVTSIGFEAFSSNKLTSVTIPNSITTINGWAFSGNNIEKIIIGRNVQMPGSQHFTWDYSQTPADSKFVEVYDKAGKAAGTYVRLKDRVGYYYWAKQ